LFIILSDSCRIYIVIFLGVLVRLVSGRVTAPHACPHLFSGRGRIRTCVTM